MLLRVALSPAMRYVMKVYPKGDEKVPKDPLPDGLFGTIVDMTQRYGTSPGQEIDQKTIRRALDQEMTELYKKASDCTKSRGCTMCLPIVPFNMP